MRLFLAALFLVLSLAAAPACEPVGKIVAAAQAHGFPTAILQDDEASEFVAAYKTARPDFVARGSKVLLVANLEREAVLVAAFSGDLVCDVYIETLPVIMGVIESAR